jgi:hypothetical protein
LTAVSNSVARRPTYEDVRAFTDKLLRGRKSDPAIAAGDERDFSCQLAHGISPLILGGSRPFTNVLNDTRLFRTPPALI